jgi:hypothetical protein
MRRSPRDLALAGGVSRILRLIAFVRRCQADARLISRDELIHRRYVRQRQATRTRRLAYIYSRDSATEALECRRRTRRDGSSSTLRAELLSKADRD